MDKTGRAPVLTIFLPRCRSRALGRSVAGENPRKVYGLARARRRLTLGAAVRYVRLCRTVWAKRILWPGKSRASDEARCRPHLPVYFGSRTIKAPKLKLEALESKVEASELELEACGPVTYSSPSWENVSLSELEASESELAAHSPVRQHSPPRESVSLFELEALELELESYSPVR